MNAAYGGSGAPPPVLSFRFSNFYAGQNDFHLFTGLDEVDWITDTSGDPVLPSQDSSMDWSARDCAFFGGGINIGDLFPYYDPDTGEFYADGVGSVSWLNNLFERVDVRAAPSSPWYPMSLTLEAYNNLFRGSRLRLQPQTSGPNWVFKDNLFDKIAFQQNTDFALDHDHNAYWPMTQAELDEWSAYINWPPAFSATLLANTGGTTDPSTDRILASPPPFQTGPFGEYYLGTSSPLYDTSNRGSRSVADAGLYHFSTRVDQIKDGAQTGNIIIGRHYVATTGASSAVAKDSNGNNVPDWIEDGDGDGISSEADMLDNYDPDADGLDIWQEQHLGLNPNVSDNPLSIQSISTDESTPSVIQVAVSVAAGFTAHFLSLYVNGQIAPESETAESISGATVVFEFDTASIDNGLVYFEPVATLDLSSSDTFTTRQFHGKPVWRVVNNPLTFKPLFLPSGSFLGGWRGFFGDTTMAVQAYSSMFQSFEYEIIIRNLGGQILKQIGPNPSGFDPNVGVSYLVEDWDLLNGSSQYQSDDEFDVQITTYSPDKASAQANAPGSRTDSKTKRIKKDNSVSDWPYAGWIITYLDFMQDATNPTGEFRLVNVSVMRHLIDLFGQNRYGYALNSPDAPQIPYPAGYNFPETKAYILHYGHTGTPEPQKTQEQNVRNVDWDKLKDFLQGKDSSSDQPGFKYRNLYISTHAAPDHIGADWHGFDAKGNMVPITVKAERAYLTVKKTKELLHTDDLQNGKPYRFVFLDGCESAKGDFPQAFCGKNLPKEETDESFFRDPQGGWLARPRAFMGWSKKPYWGVINGVCKGYFKFRQVFFQKWQENLALSVAKERAEEAVKDTGYDDENSWPDPDHKGKRIVWGDGLVIYGDRNLGIEQFTVRQ